MTDTTIFTSDNDGVTGTENAAALAVQTGTASETQTQMVAALVGEGKKYKTLDDLAKAYVNADSFIEQLKAENRELKEKATAAKTVDDVLERLQQQHTQPPADQQTKTAPAVDVSDLSKLVEATVTGLETRKQKQANLLKADAKMKELFGDKAAAKFAEVAVTPELSKVYQELASVDPDKFVSLFAEGVPKNTAKADTGGVNTNVNYSTINQTGRASTVGTKEYYDNVRRTKPDTYYSQDFQLNMDKQVRSNPNLYYGK
jgi:hypothetical protein